MESDAPTPSLRHYKRIAITSRIRDDSADIQLIFPEQIGQPPRTDVAYAIDIVEPDPTPGHIALGRFMDEWSKLELTLNSLLAKILQVEPHNMPVLVNSLGTRGLLDVLSNLGADMFDEPTTNTLVSIISRIKEANTRRNHIVHGYWMLHVCITQHDRGFTHKIEPLRAYDPSAASSRNSLMEDPRSPEKKKYHFTISRMNQLSCEIGRIRLDVRSFGREVFGTDFV